VLFDYTLAGNTEQVASLAKELLADARTQLRKESPQFADQMAPIALSLLQAKVFAQAEPLLRECLAIREKMQPDDWKRSIGRVIKRTVFGTARKAVFARCENSWCGSHGRGAGLDLWQMSAWNRCPLLALPGLNA